MQVHAELAPLLPALDLELIRVEAPTREFESLVAADAHPPNSRRWHVTQHDYSALLHEFDRSPVLQIKELASWPRALTPLSMATPHHGRFLGALRADQGPLLGLIVLTGVQAPIDSQQRQLFADLLEPLTALLAHDRRWRELERDRARAEEQRQSLLSHLGRETIVDAIVGAEGGLRIVMQRVMQVARSNSPVLLLGETGSGKEVVARVIHERSRRADEPFVRVNCGALAPELVDSELFGHEKGSFTGALAQRRGWFERADKGTLLLDEVGELPLPVQVRLLRVLQDGNLYRVGGDQPLHVDVRIIAATHRDLPAMVAAGSFREDLWYRLAIFPILIPPLRERHQDMPELAHHFARRSAARLGLPLCLPTAQDLALLEAYAWPGNVRELATVIERAALLGNGERLDCATALGMMPASTPHPAAAASSNNEFQCLDQAMAAHIRSALLRTQGRMEGPHGAARLLAINPHTLRARMRKLGINAHEFRLGKM